MSRHIGLALAGATMVAEGTALTVFGRRYLDFMDRNGLMDFGKRLLRQMDVRSPAVFAALGVTEAVWGMVLLKHSVQPKSPQSGSS